MPKSMTFALDRSSARTIDENGFMRVRACPISKEAVNPYRGDEIPDWQALGLEPDRIYQVYRPGEELAAGADTFGGLPLNLDHHEESAEAPQKDHRVGSVGTDVHFDGTYLRGTLIVTDAKAIRAIESGQAREISCAYAFDPVVRSGVFNDHPYDLVMTRIRGNHVALVDKGRAGPDVRVQDRALSSEPFEGDPSVSRKSFNSKNARYRHALRRAMARDENVAAAVKELADEVAAGADPDSLIPATSDPVNAETDPADATAATIDATAALETLLEQFAIEPEAAQALRGWLAELLAAGLDDPTDDETAETPDHPGESGPEGEPENMVSDTYLRRNGRKSARANGNARTFGAQDAALIRRQARDEAIDHIRALTDAARLVEPIVGRIDPLPYASADEIYAYALDTAGVDRRGEPASAYRGMVKTLLASRTDHPLDHEFSRAHVAQGGAFSGAQDSALAGADSPFRFLNAIR